MGTNSRDLLTDSKLKENKGGKGVKKTTVIYYHLSPSHLLMSMGTNSLVLRITLKYYRGDHKKPHKNAHPQKEKIPILKSILTKQKLGAS